MVSTTERLTINSPTEVAASSIDKKHSARKPISNFSDIFDVKNKITVLQLGSAKKKHKAIRKGAYLWPTKTNQKGHTKINAIVKQDIYD